MKEMASEGVALIGDLVGSRTHDSRRDVQQGLIAALRDVNEQVDAQQRLEPTIGDEFQGVYATVGAALNASVLVRLALPEELDVRCGLGVGTLTVVGESAYGLTQDGPAWWAAREAVTKVAELERRFPGLRTQVRDADPDADTGLVNAYALCRDELVSSFDGRERRIAWGVITGQTLAAIAESEGISASAVSQRFRRGINAVVDSVQQVVA